MRSFFGVDAEWERPLPSDWLRTDVLVAAVFFVSSVLAVECQRALGLPEGTWSRWPVVASVALGVLPLVWRRRYPVTVMLLTAVHMFVFGVAQSLVMSNLGMQAAYFFAIFTALAWAPNRRAVSLTVAGVLIFMFGWLAVQWSSASMVDRILEDAGTYNLDRGSAIMGPAAGAVLYGLLINIAYFFTAVGAGASSWRGAMARAHAEEQAVTIAQQSDQLAEQAVVAERLRIARELHDVVAHHVSAMGIQAAAARKLLTKDPEKATTALSAVEVSSRDAVTQMRQLLGTLRAGSAASGSSESAEAESNTRAPQPGLDAIDDLICEVRTDAFDVSYSNTATDACVPVSVGHSLYRTVQEALSNVRRHSTATSASVFVREGVVDSRSYIEVEVLDAGRPRSGTSGSGMGLIGMRERVRAHRGQCEIGPRVMGGYRVRVRIPLENKEK